MREKRYVSTTVHFIKYVVKSREIKILNVVLEQNHVNMFIKFLLRLIFKYCLDQIIFFMKINKINRQILS